MAVWLAVIPLWGMDSELRICDLRCEYVADPVAVDSDAPMLSWRLASDSQGKSQGAYRILVASDTSLLTEKDANLWNPGIVRSDRNLQVEYKGRPLRVGQKVYWKVMVWDENNRPSAWSDAATWAAGLKPTDWKARWIAALDDPYPDSTLTFPAPFFRKEFAARKDIKRAVAYVSGLGFYEMYLNGRKVGDHVLAPAVSNYDTREIPKILYHYDDQSTQRVYYNAFDVTDMLQKGENTVGAILGNGWYNQRDRTVEGCMWYGTPRLLLQLEIEYADGSRDMVASDRSWKYATGPLLHDGIFTGEVYDARLELGNWSRSEYDDAAWRQVVIVKSPSGNLHPQLAPYDKVTRELKPSFAGQVNDSTWRYVLPEMVSGWAELSVSGKAGDKVRLRFIGEEGEKSEENRLQSDTYILKGGGREQWEPRFTWHAFRYIEAISKDIKPDAETLLVKVVNTDPADAGTFSCSNELFNKIHQSYILTQKGNFHGSISSDCPHRERLAYTGDGQVVVESSLLSFDMAQFYRKWFLDMEDARNKNTGYVPHTAPFGGGGGGPAWGSAYVIMPWAYYCYYGDTTLLREHYEGMKHWVQYLTTRTDERGIVVREEPDGWCLGDWCTPGKVEIPEPLVNTAYYYHCADLMSKIAAVVGKDGDSGFFIELARKIKSDFNQVYFNTGTNHYWEGRQGSDVFPLAFGMVADDKKELVFNALLKHLESIKNHFDTGILATPLLLKVLTDYGRPDIAYRLMEQRTAPGFSYLLDDTYTTLWERWDGKASRDHPMFGSVVAWFYNTLAGIRPDESKPGMKHIVIAPAIAGLNHCKASYNSLYGPVRSEWECRGNTFKITVEVPVNTTASVRIPAPYKTKDGEPGKPIELSSGIYSFEASK